MTSSPRRNFAASARRRRLPKSRKAGSFLLFCASTAGALLAACSSMESPSSGTGGASGIGGHGLPVTSAGGAGAAGAGTESGGNDGAVGSCFAFDTCIPSCSSGIVTRGGGTCDNGAVVCDNGLVPLSTCASNACAQVYLTCCDDTTGETAKPACGSDGLLVACPAGNRLVHSDCVPSSLGVSTCDVLQGLACTMEAQRCTQGLLFCTCGPTPGADAGLTWNCFLTVP